MAVVTKCGRMVPAILAAVLCALSAWADSPPSAGDEARRRALYRQGKALVAAARWPEAAAKLRAVIAIRSAPKALIALAVVEEQLGHLREAKRLYRQAQLDAMALGLDRDAAAAAERIQQVDPRLARFTLEVPAGVRALVSVDGEPRFPAAGTLELDPGRHEIQVTAKGYRPYRTSRLVEEGDRRQLAVVMTRLEPSEPAQGAADDRQEADRAEAPWPIGPMVLGGTGVALAAVAIGLWVDGSSKDQALRDTCSKWTLGASETVCPAELRSDAEDAEAEIIAGNVLMGVGGAALAGAVLWWLLLPSADEGHQPATATLVVTPADVRAWVGVRF